MAEWMIEHGIGETRAVLIEDRQIIEARVELEGAVPAGTRLAAQLIRAGKQGRNAVARDAHGQEYLLPLAPGGVSEGGSLAITVTRSAFPGTEPWKRPLARASAEGLAELPSLAERLGGIILPFPAPHDTLEELGWSDLLDEARTGIIIFAGGSLRISPTPAMTLIDVDGSLPPEELAAAGARAAAMTIWRLAIGGSIGIDLPTVRDKASRLAQAEAIDAALPKPFERTAVNGFGFVQIVRPRTGPSLIELGQDRAGFEARALLRRAARSTGAIRLAAHPSVLAAIMPNWLDRLGRQIGGAVGLRPDPALAMSGGHAEQA
ncbi:MAG: ribonuclease [Pseudomonadota bacterium]|nr:ribonuclease [Pseudomonadota bacterium]